MYKWLLVIGLAVLTSACSTSTWVLQAFYSSVDDHLIDEMNEYADFTPAQQQWIERAIKSYHHWHRKVELPKYAEFLQQIDTATKNPPSKGQIGQWQAQVVDYGQTLFQCSPLNKAGTFLTGLSDRQVRQIEKHLATELKETRQEFTQQSREEHHQERYERIVTWTGRVGLALNDKQKNALKHAFKESQSLSEQWLGLKEAWSDTFVQLLKQRKQTNGAQRLEAHIAKLWWQTPKAYPEQWQHNQEVWREFIYHFFNDQTPEQNKKLSSWLSSLSGSLLTLSQSVSNTEYQKSIAIDQCQ